ncbi:hypothetical protein ACMYSQ_000098 [Aspergillus niger]
MTSGRRSLGLGVRGALRGVPQAEITLPLRTLANLRNIHEICHQPIQLLPGKSYTPRSSRLPPGISSWQAPDDHSIGNRNEEWQPFAVGLPSAGRINRMLA